MIRNNLDSQGLLTNKLKRDLGIFTTTAIVVGQMIGSGIYMMPQGLAEFSNPMMAIAAMAITGLGTIALALCFANLGEKIPVSGSSIIYTKAAFGELPSFFVGWSYWCGCWIGNIAIILGGLSYASYFIPELGENGMLKFFVAAGIIWFYTLVNIRGVKEAGLFNLILTVVKLLPLLVFMFIAIPNFDPANLKTVSSPNVVGFSGLPIAIAYSLWSYIGFEGASVNAGEVKNARIVRQATLLGTGFVILIYLLLVVLTAGNMPQGELAISNSPFSDIIYNATGNYLAGGFIALGVCISAFGCVGAWILSSARIAYSLGEQDLFPKSFANVHPKFKTPHFSLYINAILMTFVLYLSCASNKGSAYNFLVLLAVMSFLVFYVFGAASEIMLLAKKSRPLNPFNFIKNSFIGLSAFAYSAYTIYGSGAEVVMYGFLLIVIGIPFFIYNKFQNSQHDPLAQYLEASALKVKIETVDASELVEVE